MKASCMRNTDRVICYILGEPSKKPKMSSVDMFGSTLVAPGSTLVAAHNKGKDFKAEGTISLCGFSKGGQDIRSVIILTFYWKE